MGRLLWGIVISAGAGALVTVAEGLDTWVGRLGPGAQHPQELSRYDGLLWSMDASADGGTVAALRSTSQGPTEVWAGPHEGPLRRLTDLNPQLRKADWGLQERLSWRAPDGLELDGLLILHGEKDERVPVGQARYLARALRAHGRPFELVVYPREPHVIAERNRQIDVLRRSRAWFDRWLGAGDRRDDATLPAGRSGQ